MIYHFKINGVLINVISRHIGGEKMFNEYEILVIDDTYLTYQIKYKFLVMKFAGCDAKQIPTYNILKKFKTYESANKYIEDKLSV